MGNRGYRLICYNKRVEAFHFGIEGSLFEWMDYRVLMTRSTNWGTYNNPFVDIKENTSGLVELVFKPTFMKKWKITTSIAFDNGELYGNNYGGMITVSRNDVFNF